MCVLKWPLPLTRATLNRLDRCNFGRDAAGGRDLTPGYPRRACSTASAEASSLRARRPSITPSTSAAERF